MKKILSLLIIILAMAGNIDAQHLKFMGLPINGTIEEISDSLEAKGFKKVAKRNLKGYFGGYYCNVYLESASGTFFKKDDMVASVRVTFNEYQTASPDIFHRLSKWLTVKYGSYEEYTSFYHQEENGYHAHIIRAWTNDYGTITLTYGCGVSLSYIDKVSAVEGKNSDILNDL